MESFDPIAYINEPRWQNVRLGLDRTRLLMKKLGDPQNALKFVHVAGTNGKGSTCVYAANMLQAAGYKVGLYTSPYIEHFEERIQVNGQNIPYDDLVRVTLQVKKQAEAVQRETGDHPTEFELMTAVARVYYAQQGCDIVVLEVGLGGRLDSTNIIEAPEVCAIARIGLDHTAMLGNTVGEVAGEKAGIIKAGADVVSYPQEPEAAAVIEAAAAAFDASVAVPNFARLETGSIAVVTGADEKQLLMRTFNYDGLTGLQTALLGEYQPGNAAFAIEIMRALRGRGWNIPDEAIRAGIDAARWPGRFEVLPHVQGEPWRGMDGGHNPQGIEALRRTVEDIFPDKAPYVVFSLLADKDYDSMTETLADFAAGFVTMTPPNLRALPGEDLAGVLREKCDACGRADVPIVVAESFDDARQKVLSLAGPDDVVVVSGSLYSVALAKAAFC